MDCYQAYCWMAEHGAEVGHPYTDLTNDMMAFAFRREFNLWEK